MKLPSKTAVTSPKVKVTLKSKLFKMIEKEEPVDFDEEELV